MDDMDTLVGASEEIAERRRGIDGTIIYKDYLDATVCLPKNALYAFLDSSFDVVDRNYHRDKRILAVAQSYPCSFSRYVPKGFEDAPEGMLNMCIWRKEATKMCFILLYTLAVTCDCL